MSHFTRRRFLGSPAALPVGLGLAAGASAQDESATGYASMIMTGTKVLTMNSDEAIAEAIAIHGDRILAVGSDDDIRSFANAGTRRIDGRGMTVTLSLSSQAGKE